MKERLSRPEALMSAPELNALAQDCLQRQSYDEALHYLTLSLQREKSVDVYRSLGIISALKKDLEKALEFFDEALTINEGDVETISAMGDAYALSNDSMQAMGFYMLAVQMAPDVLKYKEKFAYLMEFASFNKHNEAAEKIILNCLGTSGLNCTGLAVAWYTGLISRPFFRDIFPTDQGPVVFDREKFRELADFSPFLEPYFLLGIKRLIVGNPVFEEFMTGLRGLLLEELDSAATKSKMTKDMVFTLAEAMTNYCFFTEYIFDYTEAEKEKINGLRAQIETAPDLADRKAQIVVYACYAPLYSLKNHEEILKAFKADPLMSDVIKSQINDFIKLQERAAAVQAITPIEDAVSKKVREQYEEFPYPRWQNLRILSAFEDKFLQSCAQKKNLRVLVAGCGTGQEVSWLARVLPEAHILAVDLSCASLAYAENKARSFKLDNIVFRQADILQLGSTGRKFDLISCGGVLHHMEDPVRGWRVLADILEPEGRMRIGLYSEKARRNLIEAMKIIKEKNYPSTAEGIRRFRRDAPHILRADVYISLITGFHDYFGMSMCRDLLFHVQEHRFNIPEIKKILDQLGLVFRQMSVGGAVKARYSSLYPDDPEGADIEHWNEFETANPDTFKGMYQFWCQKKSG